MLRRSLPSLATILSSAFLLFQVQPLITKIILPWFGGSAAVWSTTLLFFQLLLLGGYAYAHALVRLLRPSAQASVHIGLLAASLAFLPILPSPALRPPAGADPTSRILLLLAATIGLPYFLLSATSPLLQAWHARKAGAAMPYRWFALSNFGSLLALLSFPFLVEPRLTSRAQAYAWSGAYVVFAALCATTAWGSRSDAQRETPARSTEPRPRGSDLALWLALSACASALLVAVTNHVSLNVAPIPLMWVLPLALYLVTFILTFESDRAYERWLFLPLLVPALGAMAYMVHANDDNLPLRWTLPGFSLGLFVCCTVCHGELARRRPAAEHLTLFYLMVSAGGALGGIFVALLAPRIFSAYLELPIGLIACATLTTIAVWNVALPRLGTWPVRALAVLVTGVLSVALGREERAHARALRFQARNFYGTLSVRDDVEPPPLRTLFHGTIDHGAQILEPGQETTSTSYYGVDSGVGRAIRALQAKGPVRLGFIGLGAGVLTSYGRSGDAIRVYELNPLVETIAKTQFSFYARSRADKRILLGDARLTLEAQEPQAFDLLAVDAFSGDAVPVHLLTHEAMSLYFRHLRPGGILALHISSLYLDLEPVCQAAAIALGKKSIVVDDKGDAAVYLSSSTWVLLTDDASWFQAPSFLLAETHAPAMPAGFRPWTDDYSNLFQILTLKR